MTQGQTVPNLLDALRSHGQSDTQIARACGVDRVTVWRWRMGDMQPAWTRVDHLERLAARVLARCANATKTPV